MIDVVNFCQMLEVMKLLQHFSLLSFVLCGRQRHWCQSRRGDYETQLEENNLWWFEHHAPSTYANHMLQELPFFWANFWPGTSTAKQNSWDNGLAQPEATAELQVDTAGVHPWKPLPECQSSQIQLVLKTFTNTKYTAKLFGKMCISNIRGVID